MHGIFRFLAVTVLVLGATVALSSNDGVVAETRVPGHQSDRYDNDGDGFPDEGVIVNGKYTSVFAYEGAYGNGAYPQENWYWDLGDGRIYGTVTSIDELDQLTLTICDYQVQYRGSFDNDAFLDSGWIMNNINCRGYDDNNTYNYIIVHQSDPRFTGTGLDADWGPEWEYQILTIIGFGNLARPESPVGS